MNSYSSIIFEEKITKVFTPTSVAGLDYEWIEKFNLFKLGNGGEILSIDVNISGASHGVQRMGFWLANHDFTPQITSPRTLLSADRGPKTDLIVFYSGHILCGSNPLNGFISVYNKVFSTPIPYYNDPPIQLAFIADGIPVQSEVNFTIRGRRTQ